MNSEFGSELTRTKNGRKSGILQIVPESEYVEGETGEAVSPELHELETIDEMGGEFVELMLDIIDFHATSQRESADTLVHALLQFVNVVIGVVAVALGIEDGDEDRTNDVVHPLAVAKSEVVVAHLAENGLQEIETAVLLVAEQEVVRKGSRDVTGNLTVNVLVLHETIAMVVRNSIQQVII